MKNRGFSPAKIVLVGLMFAALYMVSKTVTPPPKEAPKPLPAVVAPALPDGSAGVVPQKPPQMADTSKATSYMHDVAEQEKRAKVKASLEKKLNNNKPLPPEEEISPQYFNGTAMGTAGQNAADEDAAKRKKIADTVQKEMVTEQKPVPLPK